MEKKLWRYQIRYQNWNRLYYSCQLFILVTLLYNLFCIIVVLFNIDTVNINNNSFNINNNNTVKNILHNKIINTNNKVRNNFNIDISAPYYNYSVRWSIYISGVWQTDNAYS
jgi:hypothetical protein